MVLRIFKIALFLSVWHFFMWQLLEILNVFNTLTLKQIFLKTKIFFKKLEEANVKTNRMGGTKWTNHWEQSLSRNYFIYLLTFFVVSESFTKIWFDVPTTQISIFILSVTIEVLLQGHFFRWVSLNICKLDWEENLFDFYAEKLLSESKYLLM